MSPTAPTGHRFIIPHLEGNTTYLMRAASRNLAGLSDWSNVKIFATATAARRQMTPGWACLLLWFIGLALVYH